ncbi:restriction endonuclease subunit S [Mesoplasma tabanidae]|uniref:Type I restriction enzyme, S subunit n=1 Tax=Mesoplasma tabanidae TaxID=219745 RepID=A0A2K8P440_9MOLU|nr:restriction endonuclease subunit S [Mesoplasma tabanidae]ATZ21521.1 type I restriction enzyme, S subunit [Mesoplasma tabanidae]
MAIYKLGDICKVKRGSSPRPISQWLTKEKCLRWAKISDLESNSISTTKEFVHLSWENKGLIGLRNDLFITNSATPGVPFLQLTDEKIAYHDGFLSLKPNENIVLKKYLLYKLIIDRPRLIQLGNGAVFVNLSSEILKNWLLDLPSLKEQQKIIDIIEPIENLFLKYSNCVRIDSFNNCKEDVKKIIDIIEPFEVLKEKNQKLLNLILKLITENSENIIANDLESNKLEIYQQKEEKFTEGFYSQTADIGNFNNKIKKQQYYSKLPSRAKLRVQENTLYISKLLGERKILFSSLNKDLIISNGMWGIKSDSKFKFSNLSFFMSNYFYNKKKLFSTGTTMVGLNDQGLKKIINEVKIIHDLETEKLLEKLFNMLSISSEIDNKVDKLIDASLKLLIK